MDYAIQLLAIICLFLFGGLWLKDNMGLPLWGVVSLFFIGFGAGMAVLYLRGQEESKKVEKRSRENPIAPPAVADNPVADSPQEEEQEPHE
ncbi:MAG: AtpZ/AtpI family protein [Vampirovibrionales bacterium]|nr:AtpZ/AtpI family protein [Vampirovibrionales bacterium]